MGRRAVTTLPLRFMWLTIPCQHGVRGVSAEAGTVGCMTELAIEATGLAKSFGETKALAGVNIAARRGSVLAVLGPKQLVILGASEILVATLP